MLTFNSDNKVKSEGRGSRKVFGNIHHGVVDVDPTALTLKHSSRTFLNLNLSPFRLMLCRNSLVKASKLFGANGFVPLLAFIDVDPVTYTKYSMGQSRLLDVFVEKDCAKIITPEMKVVFAETIMRKAIDGSFDPCMINMFAGPAYSVAKGYPNIHMESAFAAGFDLAREVMSLWLRDNPDATLNMLIYWLFHDCTTCVYYPSLIEKEATCMCMSTKVISGPSRLRVTTSLRYDSKPSRDLRYLIEMCPASDYTECEFSITLFNSPTVYMFSDHYDMVDWCLDHMISIIRQMLRYDCSQLFLFSQRSFEIIEDAVLCSDYTYTLFDEKETERIINAYKVILTAGSLPFIGWSVGVENTNILSYLMRTEFKYLPNVNLNPSLMFSGLECDPRSAIRLNERHLSVLAEHNIPVAHASFNPFVRVDFATVSSMASTTLKYREGNLPNMVTIKNGQLKLFLSTVYTLLMFYRDMKRNNPSMPEPTFDNFTFSVLYIGAYPGTNIALIAKYFKNCLFVCFDPGFKRKYGKNIVKENNIYWVPFSYDHNPDPSYVGCVKKSDVGLTTGSFNFMFSDIRRDEVRIDRDRVVQEDSELQHSWVVKGLSVGTSLEDIHLPPTSKLFHYASLKRTLLWHLEDDDNPRSNLEFIEPNILMQPFTPSDEWRGFYGGSFSSPNIKGWLSIKSLDGYLFTLRQAAWTSIYDVADLCGDIGCRCFHCAYLSIVVHNMSLMSEGQFSFFSILEDIRETLIKSDNNIHKSSYHMFF